MGSEQHDPSRRPVLLTPQYEPRPFWYWFGRKWFVVAFFRPDALGIGLQFMWGGVAFIFWPVMIAVCDLRKMPSSKDQADGK